MKESEKVADKNYKTDHNTESSKPCFYFYLKVYDTISDGYE